MELTVITMAFEAADPDTAGALAAVLSRYVVLTRARPGCRNVDLCASLLAPGRFVIIEKWESPQAQRAHFDSPETVTMARSCTELLAQAPLIDLLEGLSAHDLA